MTNNDNENSPQVHLIDKIESNLRIATIHNYLNTHFNTNTNTNNQHHNHPSSSSSISSSNNNNNSINHNHRNVDLETKSIRNTTHLTSQKTNPKYRFSSNNNNDNSSPNNYLKSKEYVSFMPFADENDRSCSFQLSKLVDNNTEQYTSRKTKNDENQLPFVRTFGYNRTNLMFNTPTAAQNINFTSNIHTSPHVSRFNIKSSSSSNSSSISNSRLTSETLENVHGHQLQQQQHHQVFRPILPDSSHRSNFIMTSSNNDENALYHQNNAPLSSNRESCIFLFNEDSGSNSMLPVKDEMMTFKNYDLNDEYWLNFDQ